MTRASWLSTAIAIGGVATSLWLYRQNCALHDQLAAAPKAAQADAPHPSDDDHPAVAPAAPRPRLARPAFSASAPPQLEAIAPVDDLKLDVRTRKLVAFTSLFGRHDGESESDYRARIGPLLAAGLAVPRVKVSEMREQAQAKANVSPAQAAALDRAFAKTYDQVLDYANKSIADGALSPYQHDLAGWLEFAGGLGGILGSSQDQIAQILSADQLKTMTAAGFDWGEYLGASAPWENLSAPPPPKN